ncbi:hypothetical protein F5B21DRAFT_506216 [Xylaria acuta]|nr:hypothetical protein F5B21DRAFT_506216 [Xylaria acuta]
MKSVLAVSFSLLGLFSAHPAPHDEPVRILPVNWGFEITSLKGPGCPDFGVPDSGSERHTRTTYVENTADGSEIYYWFIAYPSLRVELGKTDSTWCETELQYTDDVEATFSFEYLDAGVTDSYTIRGPAASGKNQEKIGMVSPKSNPQYKEPQCGASKLKFRTELKIAGTGKKGVVDSEHSTDKDGKVQYYGTQLGFSYDWEKCKKLVTEIVMGEGCER